METNRLPTGSKLAPWNWFREEPGMPARRSSASSDPFFRMRDEMERLLEDTFRTAGMPALGNAEVMLSPSMDIRELPDRYEVTAEVPGVTQNDLQLTVENDMLMISGEKRSEYEDKDDEGNLRRTERSYGRFQRVLALPMDAKGDEVKASFRNGILTINVPRDENQSTRGRKIEIEGDSAGGEQIESQAQGQDQGESQTH